MNRIFKKNNRERGIALPFLAVVLVGIIAMIGLAIDLYFLTNSKSQYQSAADAASLAAIEEFLQVYDANSSDPSNSRSSALNAAVEKATRILKANTDVLINQSRFEDSSKTQSQLALTADANAIGVVEPGRWIKSDPPYFERITNNTDIPNAFRINIRTNPDSSISTTFLNAVGIKNYALTAEAISSQVPRRAVFLIDMSPSIHASTHNPAADPDDGEQRAYFAFPLDVSSCPPTIETSHIHSFGESDPNILSNPENPRKIFDDLDAIVSDPNLSYKADYACQSIPGSSDGVIQHTHFAVDMRRTPQPLTNVLTGVYQALTDFQTRSVAGDRVGVFGFDDRLDGFLDLRSTTFGGEPALVKPSNSSFIAMRNALNPASPRGYLSKFLFPQFYSNNPPAAGADPRAVNTDIKRALEQARDLLEAEGDSNNSDNFIVLFSDGRSNCADIGIGQGFQCHSSDFFYHKKAINDAVDFAEDDIDNIALHVVLVGENVRPHTKLKPGLDTDRTDGVQRPDTCLDDLTARQVAALGQESRPDKLYFVESSSDDDDGDVPDPYYYPNKFYFAARATGGLWVPLREPCRDLLGNPVDLLEPVADTSAPSTISTGALHRVCLNHYQGRPNVSIDTDEIRDRDGNGTMADLLENNGIVDDEARILCDPEGRMMQTQITEFINTLLSQNPIRLVGR